MIWHYTVRAGAKGVLREAVLRAYPVIVCRDLFGRDRHELAPAVWFTSAVEIDGPVRVKQEAEGWSRERPGDWWRFGVAEESVPLDLPEWAFRHEYETKLFRWMLLTARMAGSNHEDWRLSDVDVPRQRWLAVESLHDGKWRAA